MDIRLRLIGGPAPSGELRAHDGARMLGALHELSIRLGRHHADSVGPGRSHRSIEELCEVRLSSLTGGSTTATLTVGPADVLPLEIEDTRWQEHEFIRILEGIAADERPDDVPDLVADAVADLTQVLRLAAKEVELRVGLHQVPRFPTARIRRETWATPRRHVDEDVIAFVGTLMRVDLFSHELRLRDDIGSTLDLVHVVHPIDAGALLGRRARARGRAIRDRDGRLVGLDAPTLTASTLPFPDQQPTSITDQLVTLPEPDPEDGIELSDAEFEEFVRAMGR